MTYIVTHDYTFRMLHRISAPDEPIAYHPVTYDLSCEFTGDTLDEHGHLVCDERWCGAWVHDSIAGRSIDSFYRDVVPFTLERFATFIFYALRSCAPQISAVTLVDRGDPFRRSAPGDDPCESTSERVTFRYGSTTRASSAPSAFARSIPVDFIPPADPVTALVWRATSVHASAPSVTRSRDELATTGKTGTAPSSPVTADDGPFPPDGGIPYDDFEANPPDAPPSSPPEPEMRAGYGPNGRDDDDDDAIDAPPSSPPGHMRDPRRAAFERGTLKTDWPFP